MANEVAKKSDFEVGLSASLMSVKDALPAELNVARFVQNSVAFLNGNDALIEFSKKHGTAQIKQGIMKGAFLGLDAMNKECYLIPYGNQLNFMIDYRGNVKLAKKYSIRPIKDIYAKIVRKGDEFEETVVAGEPSLNFKPLPFNDGEIVGAFAVCLYKDGGMIYDTMSLAELENTRKSSKASNSPAWKNFTSEMYKKTVLHRLCKHIELEFDNKNQRDLFEEDVAIETDTQKIVEMEIEENANSVEFVEDVAAEDVKEVLDVEVVED